MTGACLGRAGLNRKTPLATLTLILAAEAPDIDILGGLRGPAFQFAHHRGFTHSFLGVPVDAAVVIGFVYLLWRLNVWRRRGRGASKGDVSPRWPLLFFYACLAGLSHILLDFTNAYGVRPLWPFSERWYSWDIVFIFEPIMFTCLVFGLAAPLLFALIDQEVGARKTQPRGRIAATLALTAVVTLWTVRDFEHRRAIHALEARTYHKADPIRASAYPALASPFQWYGVVETDNFFVLAPVDSLKPEVNPGSADDEQMQLLYKPEETLVTRAAKNSYLGRVYLDWAAYPITQTESLANGYEVTLQDLRYAQMPALFSRARGERETAAKALSAGVELDRNGKVVGDVYGSGASRRSYPEP